VSELLGDGDDELDNGEAEGMSADEFFAMQKVLGATGGERP